MDRRREFAVDSCWNVDISRSVSMATLSINMGRLVLFTRGANPGPRVSTHR